MAPKATLAVVLMLCCATAALATYQCTYNKDCGKSTQCVSYKCDYGKCKTNYQPDGYHCNADGNPCTVGDACYSGVCKPGPLKTCPSSNPCKAGYCNKKSGQCAYKTYPDNTPCDDGNKNTYDDKCHYGVCKGVPKYG